MPVTRSEKAATAGSGILQAPEKFQTASEQSAKSLSAVQSDMDDRKDLQDGLILRLWAAVKASRKLVDEVTLEITDQVEIIKVAKGDDTNPQEIIGQYTQQLSDLLEKGDSLLSDFESKNSSLLEKLDFLMLKGAVL